MMYLLTKYWTQNNFKSCTALWHVWIWGKSRYICPVYGPVCIVQQGKTNRTSQRCWYLDGILILCNASCIASQSRSCWNCSSSPILNPFLGEEMWPREGCRLWCPQQRILEGCVHSLPHCVSSYQSTLLLWCKQTCHGQDFLTFSPSAALEKSIPLLNESHLFPDLDIEDGTQVVFEMYQTFEERMPGSDVWVTSDLFIF